MYASYQICLKMYKYKLPANFTFCQLDESRGMCFILKVINNIANMFNKLSELHNFTKIERIINGDPVTGMVMLSFIGDHLRKNIDSQRNKQSLGIYDKIGGNLHIGSFVEVYDCAQLKELLGKNVQKVQFAIENGKLPLRIRMQVRLAALVYLKSETNPKVFTIKQLESYMELGNRTPINSLIEVKDFNYTLTK